MKDRKILHSECQEETMGIPLQIYRQYRRKHADTIYFDTCFG